MKSLLVLCLVVVAVSAIPVSDHCSGAITPLNIPTLLQGPSGKSLICLLAFPFIVCMVYLLRPSSCRYTCKSTSVRKHHQRKAEDDDSEESFFLFPMGRPHKKQVPSVVEVEVGDSDEDSDAAFFPSFFRPLYVNPFSFMNFGFSDFFSRPSWFDSLIPKDIPEDAVKNSTSSTKVIDGHKITVNETTYENEKNGAIFKFQIIDIKPFDTKETDEEKPTEGQTPDSRVEQPEEPVTRTDAAEEIKPDQNSQDNEIHREEILANYELQGDDPSVYDKNVEIIDFGNGHTGNHRGVVDLSSDTRVNTLIAENARRGGLFMVPPEVEVFDSLIDDAHSQNYQQPLEVQQVIPGQYNQQTIKPSLYQQTIRPQFDPQQEFNPPQYNPQHL